MTTTIKFGTSGWRAIVADEFTVANIRRAVAGIATYVKTQPAPHRVLVGRDPRFLGESFVDEADRILAAAGVTPIIIPKAAPTPAVGNSARTGCEAVPPAPSAAHPTRVTAMRHRLATANLV